MSEIHGSPLPADDVRLTRTQASQAVETAGWRYLLGNLATSVSTRSFDQGLLVAGAAAAACDGDTDHLRADIRPERVELSLQHRASGAVTARDVRLALAVSASLDAAGFTTAGATAIDVARPVQMLEMAIDALDIPAIRPFWKAVMAYADEPGSTGPDDAIVDPVGQGPAIWFQQMESPRPQRNRIHFDIAVAHDEAVARVEAALAAGGILVDDSYARSFWVLADVEGNEICVCTWTDRDERDQQRAESQVDGG